jgi:hypothetical protein
MATNMDKGLYQAPEGLEALASQEPEIEIEIEDPESVTIGMDGLEIEIEPGVEYSDDFDSNIADEIGDSMLATIAGELIGLFDDDINSRKDWVDTYVEGIELLGLKVEDRTEPWPGACSVYHPLLTEAIVKFQAETMVETFPASGPVKTRIIGKQTPEKEEAAVRVKEDMNYQLTEKMPEYRPEHERMLWGLGLSGNAFKKVYYDPSLKRQKAVYVPAEDVVMPYGAESLETSPRVTHVMRKTENEIKRLQIAGFYRDVELGEPSHVLDEIEKKIAEKLGFNATMDDRFKVLEMHIDLDLSEYGYEDGYADDSGLALPYVITIEKGTSNILAIRRNWTPDDETKQKRQHFIHYEYVPGFGVYALGLVHLIGAAAKSGTMLLRQLVDAGTLSNLPGGMKARGLRIKGDDTPIAPGEFRDVDVPSGTIRDNILPLPYKEPSSVLMTLMDKIIEEARGFANSSDLQVSDMSAQAPVGTTLAILEQTVKVMSAVQARIHYAMKQEFKLLAGIIRDYTPEEYSYEPEEGDRQAKQSDYDMVEVIPVSDPNAATMAQKVVQYQAVMQMASQYPQIYDMVELNRQMLEVLGIKNIGKLIPAAEDEKPKDPVSENMAIINGKPVKAFIYQDHQAHIQVHMAAMQDPKIMQLVGQNPQAQAIQAAAMAHINEHIAFEYRKQIEDTLGLALPAPDENLSPEDELQMSRAVADAAQQLLQKNQAEAAAQQAEQLQQDPIIQMQQAELQLKAQEVQIKAQKTQADIEAESRRLAIEEARIASQERIAGAQIGAKAESDKTKMDAQQYLEGAKLGMKAVADERNRETQLDIADINADAQKQKMKQNQGTNSTEE